MSEGLYGVPVDEVELFSPSGESSEFCPKKWSREE